MERSRLIALFIVFTLGGLADCIPARGQEPIAAKTFKLSLEEVTRLALANNFDIQLAKYDAWIARTDKGAAESIYDTIFTAEVQYQNDQRRRTSTILGSKTVDNDYNIGLSKKLPTGTTVSVDLDNNRSWTNSAFSTAPLTHESNLGVTVEQELGKNFFGIQDRGDVKITLLDIENTEYTSLTKIETHLAEVQKAYWNLVLQVEQVKIEEEMVAEAKRLYDLHQEKLKDGLVEIPEAIASEANYKERKNALTLVRNAMDTKINALKLLLNIPDDDIRIEPTATLELPQQTEELAQSLKEAFEHRRDYKEAHNEIKSKDIQLSMKKNNLWPEMNLTATLERNGLGDHFQHAVTRISDENNPNLFAGLEITLPLENTEARAKLKAAELEKARAILELKLLERRIAVDIIDQVRDCNVFRELAGSSQEIAELQAQKLAEEQKRFQRGRSSTDTMIRFQEDVIQARSLAAQARHRYCAAVVDLRLKEGKLLNKYWKGEL